MGQGAYIYITICIVTNWICGLHTKIEVDCGQANKWAKVHGREGLTGVRDVQFHCFVDIVYGDATTTLIPASMESKWGELRKGGGWWVGFGVD